MRPVRALSGRIDHRTLVAQRADALARADTGDPLDLDRIHQIHVGKAVHVRHHRFTVYKDRRDQNRAILDRSREHPMFTVIAKDLASAFHGLGMTNLPGLRQALESIRREEDRLFADRAEHIENRPKLPPRPSPPRLPKPEADRLRRLQQALLVPHGIYRARLGQLQAFDRRFRPQHIASRSLHDGPYRIRARPI